MRACFARRVLKPEASPLLASVNKVPVDQILVEGLYTEGRESGADGDKEQAGMGRPLVIPWQEGAETLRELYKAEKDAEIRPRLQALWLVRAGHSLRETSEVVGIHYVTLQSWIAWYRQGGVAEVRRHKNGGRQGRASLLTAEQIAALREQATRGEFRTAQDVGVWLEQRFGVRYRPGGLYSLLGRLWWGPKVTRPQSITTSAEVQDAWKKKGCGRR